MISGSITNKSIGEGKKQFGFVVMSFTEDMQASHSGPNFRQKSEFRLLGQKWSEKSLIFV